MIKKFVFLPQRIMKAGVYLALLLLFVSLLVMMPKVAEILEEVTGINSKIIQATAFNMLLVGTGILLVSLASAFVSPVIVGVVVVSGLVLAAVGIVRILNTLNNKPTDTGIYPDSLTLTKK